MESDKPLQMGALQAGRYQIVNVSLGGSAHNSRVILLDAESGRTWTYEVKEGWSPIPFKGDAPPAPKK